MQWYETMQNILTVSIYLEVEATLYIWKQLSSDWHYVYSVNQTTLDLGLNIQKGKYWLFLKN